MLGIEAVAALSSGGVRMPFAVEVYAFGDEEGSRFPAAMLTSRAAAGTLDPAALEVADRDGVRLADLVDLAAYPSAARAPGEVLAYLEAHIEQGPVLEAEGLAVGVVSAIAGQSRFKLTWTGKAGHAGTTPMALRRDALAGAAEFTLAVEQLARGTPGLVATVGALTVSPGAANVIPGGTLHTLDVRHASDAKRRTALVKLGRQAAEIARRRGLKVSWQRTQDNGAVTCSPALTARLTESVAAVQGRSLALVSGAGHDGVVMSQLTPVAMLFVRCREGLSHHPDEYAAPRDLAVARRVMVDFLERMAQQDPL
jgi:allantoate deiminase